VGLIACENELMQLGAITEKLVADVPGRQERQSGNIRKVEKLICSQENAFGTTKVYRKLSKSRGLQEVSL